MDHLTITVEKGDREVIASRSDSSSSSSSSGSSDSSPSSSDSSSSPGPYSDISDDDLDMPPPAPKVPHPDIVAELKTPRPPDILYRFESSGSIPVRLLHVVSSVCEQRRTQILTSLAEKSKSCSTRSEFHVQAEHLLKAIEELVKICRKAAVQYHLTLDVGSAVINRRKFAVYK